MGETIISDVAQHLTDIIKEQINNEIHLVKGMDKEVLGLSEELKALRRVLDDAENRRFQEQIVDHWLTRLEQTSYEMEDVLDEWNYAILKHKMNPVATLKHKVCSFIPSPCLCFKQVYVRHDIVNKIKYLKEHLDQLLKEKDRFGFVELVPTTDHFPESLQVKSTFLIDSAKVQGRDEDVDFLVRKLTDDGGRQHESGIPVLSILGMGGIGKTTLARILYNHSRVKKSYDLRIWICVTEKFDLTSIAKEIIESIGRHNYFPYVDHLDALLALVSESILGKKFLLVLDDVWSVDRDKWKSLENSLQCGALGSNVFVTTRIEMVGKMMGSRDYDMHRLGLLSDEDSWLLLCHVALSERNEVGFEEIGKKIAKKCHGLPLEIKILGGLLRFKNSLRGWESVLNNRMRMFSEEDGLLLTHMRLGYNDLSPKFKLCFSYCAIFPRDTRIDVERLIENWIALGYFGSNDGGIEKGRECFDVLAMRSLFQDFEIDGLDEKIRSCKMHDLVHDLAQSVRKSGRLEGARMNKRTCQTCDPMLVSNVNEFCSLFWDEEEYPPSFCDCLTRVRVLSMNCRGFRSIPQGMEKLIHLRWLDLSGNTLSHGDINIIFQLYYLQTLLLSNCSLEEIPREIGNLIQLRHLDLSFNASLMELPESICGLHELRILAISYCTNLRRIPEGLAQLTNLRELSEFQGGRGWSKLGLLKKLNHLSGDLRLIVRLGDEDLEEVVEDAREAELKNKIHIQTLEILFEDDECSSRVMMNVMDALEPHPNLQNLVVERYMGHQLPLSWMVSQLNQLRRIVLSECNHLSSLPPFGRLPCLEEILIQLVKELEIVGREFLGIDDIESSSNTVIAFPKLKKLAFKSCPMWEEWEDITAEEEQHSSIMPRLTHLSISDCPRLKKLPLYLLKKAWPLNKLRISDSEELQQNW